MLGRIIGIVVFTVAFSVTASAQERLPRAPDVAPNPKAVTVPKRVVVRRAPTLDLMTRVTVTRGLKSIKYRVIQAEPIKKPGLDAGDGRSIFGVPLDFEHLEDFWLIVWPQSHIVAC